jgi:hypothetical protein
MLSVTEVYQAINILAEMQNAAIVKDDLSEFWDLCSRREEVFAALGELDPKGEHLSEHQETVNSILEWDQKLNVHMTRIMVETKDELEHLEHGIAAIDSYNGAHLQEAFFLDRST